MGRSEKPTIVMEHVGIVMELDDAMHFRIGPRQGETTVADGWAEVDSGGETVDEFALESEAIRREQVTTDLGQAQRLTVSGVADLRGGRLRRTLTVDAYPQWPNAFILEARYENLSPVPVNLDRVAEPVLQLDSLRRDAANQFWSFQGAAVEWGQDFAFPLPSFFFRDNYLGHSDGGEGGGIPLVYVWNRQIGVALAHIEPVPQLWYVPGVAVVSLAVAMLMNRKIHGISLYRTAYFLPVVTSAVAAALVWQMIYGRDTGLLNYVIERLGGKPVCWLCPSKALYSVVIVNVWGAIGEGMIIFLAGLQAIPRDYYEAATVDGASGWQRFFRITVPLLTPSIFFQTLITTINAFQAYEYIYMLTRCGQGDSSVPVVVFSIYRRAFNFFRMGEASALAIELAVMVIALMAVYFWLERRYVVYE